MNTVYLWLGLALVFALVALLAAISPGQSKKKWEQGQGPGCGEE